MDFLLKANGEAYRYSTVLPLVINLKPQRFFLSGMHATLLIGHAICDLFGKIRLSGDLLLEKYAL
jgi:hypothetical protein